MINGLWAASWEMGLGPMSPSRKNFCCSRTDSVAVQFPGRIIHKINAVGETKEQNCAHVCLFANWNYDPKCSAAARNPFAHARRERSDRFVSLPQNLPYCLPQQQNAKKMSYIEHQAVTEPTIVRMNMCSGLINLKMTWIQEYGQWPLQCACKHHMMKRTIPHLTLDVAAFHRNCAPSLCAKCGKISSYK